MDRRIFYVIGAAAAAMLSSCAKVEMTGGANSLDPNQIAFSVRSGLQGPSGTRSGAGDEQPALLLGAQGEDTLYLHPSVVVNDRGFGMPATRGVPVTKDNISSFTVTAKVHGSETPYMNEVKVTRQGDSNVWTTSDGKHFWPDEKTTLNFYAYSNLIFAENDNSDSPGVSSLTCEGGRLGFSYIVPNGTGGSDAERQPDILFALASANRSQTQDGDGTVILNFQHALAGVQFRAKNIAGGTIQSITLKNLYGQGDCTYTLSGETTGSGARKNGTFKWDKLRGDKKNFTQTMSVDVKESSTMPDGTVQDVTNGENSEMTFMMIPQSTEGVEVEIVLKGDHDQKTYIVSGKLSGPDATPLTWKPGKIYIYDISTDSINWEYVFEVTPSITLPLGTTTGQYTVTSYRQRKGDPSTREAVAWKAKNTSFSETDPEKGEVETTLKDILLDFTYQDENPSESKSYSLKVTTTTLRTTHPGDQTLKENTQRGSADSPYDLSTHDEKGSVIPQTTANCYVVSAAGTYQLPLVYGNALKNGSENSAAYQGGNFKDYLNRTISSSRITGADNAVLVWSDGFFMFKDIHLDEARENLVFTIDPDYMQQANAVLAVRDASNRIMWSWHIWVTERPVYTQRHILQDFFDGSNTYELMQCNLGWVDGKKVYYNQRDLTFRFTQAGSGKTDELNVTQEGATFDYKDVGSTYYQWGRKDPLVALKNWNSYGYKDYRLHETGDPDYVYRYETGPTSIGNAIQHPNVFYTRGTTGAADWNSDHITTLWNTNENGGTLESTTSVKTIYDPSPRGFKVPMPRAFAIFVGGYTGDGTDGTGVLNGYVFEDNVHNKYRVYPQANGGGTEIPLTATGQRADIGGKLEVYEQNGPLKAEVGGLWSLYGVYYWTCVPIKTQNTAAYTLVIRKDDPSGIEVYSYGFAGTKTMARPVRPIVDRE